MKGTKMQLDMSYAGILSRVKKFDIYVKGGEGMSGEQTKAFNQLIRGREKALAFAMCQEGQDLSIEPEEIFIAPNDQRESFEKEFNCKVQFRIGIGHFRIDIASNVGVKK
jgi:hypothetical protein